MTEKKDAHERDLNRICDTRDDGTGVRPETCDGPSNVVWERADEGGQGEHLRGEEGEHELVAICFVYINKQAELN
jgi:hypothetical protein